MSGAHVAPYALAQVVGAVLGAELANLMYQVPLDQLSTKDRTGRHLLLGEVVATVGLVAAGLRARAHGAQRARRPRRRRLHRGRLLVHLSTSFANPAVTVGRVFSDTFAGIAPGPSRFVAAQLVGGLLAVGLVAWLYPSAKEHPMTTSPETPQVVFACVRNGGRSVIGRVLTEHYAGGHVVGVSAGTQPGEHIHREVADVLERLGLDTSQEKPTLLTRDTIAASTLAVTLGCGEECPYVPGVRYVDWPVADPGGQDEETVRGIVADIDERVRGLLVDLVPDIDLPPSVLKRSTPR